MYPVSPDRTVGDPGRLTALDALAVLDTQAEQGFDDVVRLATRLCAAPVALVSLVSADRQWFKARAGFPSCETDLDRSVCKFALDAPDLLVIPDLTVDPRTAANPLVTGEPHIRFYAGAPLRLADGLVVGALCVIDTLPRAGGLPPEQAEDLRALARQVVAQLELGAALRIRDAAAEAERRQTTLLGLGDQLRDLDTVAAIVQAAAKIVAEALGASRAGYGLVDVAGETVDIPTDWCASGVGSIAGTHRLLDYGNHLDDLKRGEIVFVEDVAADARSQAAAGALLAMGIRTMVNVPVMERGRLVGLGFVHSAHGCTFRAEELAFVRTVTDRIQVAVARVQAEQQRALLNGELSHRLKNTLAMVQGIASQTLRAVPDQAPVQAFTERLIALSQAHDVLMQDSWAAAPIRSIIEKVLALQASLDRFRIEGPSLALAPQATLSLSLLLHELTTNAVKYGSLSRETGVVHLAWRIEEDDERTVVLTWQESGGPPVEAPTRRGFGARLIQVGLVGTRDTRLTYASTGLDAEFRAPMSQVFAS